MAELLVQSESLINIANAIRKVENATPSGEPRIDPAWVLTEGTENTIGQLTSPLTIYYWEYYDETSQNLQQSGGSDGKKEYSWYGYKQRKDNGKVVPVLYERVVDEEHEFYRTVFTDEPFYYEGLATIDGQEYSKWRNIEKGGELSWTGAGRKFMYTDVVVIGGEPLTLAEMPERIENLVTTVTGTGDATAAEILFGKKAWVDGNEITGTMPNNSRANTTITETAGTSTFSVTAVNDQALGYTSGGKQTASKTYSLVASTSEPKAMVMEGTNTLASVTLADNDFIAENIKAGVNIFGKTGTYTQDATAAASNIHNGKTAYVNGKKVVGTAPTYAEGVGATETWLLPYLNQYYCTPKTGGVFDSGYYGTTELLTTENYPWSMATEVSMDYHCEYDHTSLSNSKVMEISGVNNNPYFYICLYFEIAERGLDINGDQTSARSYRVLVLPPEASNSIEETSGGVHTFDDWYVEYLGWRFSPDGN